MGAMSGADISAGIALALDFINGATSLDRRITFSRTSNATLTNSNGRVAYAPHNLLTNSEDFEASAWTKTNASITANAAVAPDGTTTADRLIPALSATDARASQAVTGVADTRYTLSAYGKADAFSSMRVYADNGASSFALVAYNLSTGAVLASATTGGTWTGAASTIENVGNGWYRITLSWLATGAAPTRSQIWCLNTGDGTSGIFIWGAQLNVANAPVNLLTFSGDLANAAWTLNNPGTRTGNTDVAPDGTTTAATITDNITSNFTSVRQTVTVANNSQQYTASVYIKKTTSASSYPGLGLTLSGGTIKYASLALNTTTGAATARTGETPDFITVTDVGTYWRVQWAITNNTTGNTSLIVDVYAAVNIDASATWTATTTGSTVAWGAQLNTGSTALPYVATTSSIYLPPSYNSTTPKNLLGFTQEFDNAAWTKSTVTVSANAVTDPNGTLTADRVTPTGTAVYDSRVFQPISAISGVVYTLSVWAKSSASNPSLTLALLNWGGQTFSLTSNWARYSVSVTAASTISANFNIYAGVVNPTNGVVSSINEVDIWGAQLSNSASVDSYVYNPAAAPTSTAYYGPRFDYNPTTLAANGLLIEEQRTNLFLNSDFNTGGAGTGLVTSSTMTGPTGATITAAAFGHDGTTTSFLYKGTVAATTQYAISVFVRMDDGNAPVFGSATSDSPLNDFALVVSGATFSPLTFTIQNFGGGLYRVAGVVTSQATNLGNNGVVKYNTNSNRTFKTSAWQIEAGSFATSLIPTVASQVTRAADNASMLGDNFATWYNQTESTLSVQWSQYALPSTTSRVVTIDNGTVNSILQIQSSSSNRTGALDVGGAGVFAYSTSAITVNAINKGAVAIKTADSSVSFGGTITGTSTTAYTPPAMNTLRIGSNVGSGQYLNGTVRSLAYYPVRLPAATLQSITA